MQERNTTKFAKKNRETILPTKQARWLNDILAVLLFALAVILTVMMATYSVSDRCWFKVTESMVIHNKVGIVGAYLSDIIFSLFGKSGWWLVIGLFYLGYRKIMRISINTGNWYNILQILSFIILLLASTVFEYITLYFHQSNALHNGYGGLVGRLLFYHFLPMISQSMMAVLILLLIVCCFSFTFSLRLPIIIEKIGFVLEIILLLIYRKFTNNTIDFNTSSSDNERILDNKYIKVGEDVSTSRANGILTPYKMHSLLESKVSNKLDETVGDTVQPIPKQSVAKQLQRVTTIKSTQTTGLPSISLLNDPILQADTVSQETLEFVSLSIENKLAEFGVEAKIINAESGPVITRYELLPSRGVRGEKIVGLGKEIARGLALTNVRIVETIPGKNSMGIEVPNFKRKIIYLKEIFDSGVYNHSISKLTLALGKDISGKVVITDLAKMPHLLVAGTTGSGKSVAVNAMILSILFQATPDEVKFIMIDPKMVELSFYQDIPHLLAPVVTDMTQAGNALKWTVGEMERRYKTMAKTGCKNLASFNQKIQDAEIKGMGIPNPFSQTPDTPENLSKWPYIVVIIDELADLMMVTGKKTEQYIARIAQKARAVGIHLIVATQRPSVDVITGLIKANIPARISFQVSSKIDSRTILDQMGAETLLGQGDMLFLQPGSGFPQRIHGAYVNDDELNKVVEYLKLSSKPNYLDEILTGETDGIEILGIDDDSNNEVEKDTMFDEAVKFIYDSKRCSISSLQTRFGIGYNRAARIMAHLETIGMVRRNERGAFELLKNTDVN